MVWTVACSNNPAAPSASLDASVPVHVEVGGVPLPTESALGVTWGVLAADGAACTPSTFANIRTLDLVGLLYHRALDAPWDEAPPTFPFDGGVPALRLFHGVDAEHDVVVSGGRARWEPDAGGGGRLSFVDGMFCRTEHGRGVDSAEDCEPAEPVTIDLGGAFPHDDQRCEIGTDPDPAGWGDLCQGQWAHGGEVWYDCVTREPVPVAVD